MAGALLPAWSRPCSWSSSSSITLAAAFRRWVNNARATPPLVPQEAHQPFHPPTSILVTRSLFGCEASNLIPRAKACTHRSSFTL